jgi:hypothetical protein
LKGASPLSTKIPPSPLFKGRGIKGEGLIIESYNKYKEDNIEERICPQTNRIISTEREGARHP